MNRYQLLFIFLFCSLSMAAQDLDSLGKDSNPILHTNEAVFLNGYITIPNNGFNFLDKKIAFVGGSSGTVIISKQDYFKQIREYHPRKVNTTVILLTAEEKIRSGGYDAIVTIWVKALIRKKKLIELLRRR